MVLDLASLCEWMAYPMRTRIALQVELIRCSILHFTSNIPWIYHIGRLAQHIRSPSLPSHEPKATATTLLLLLLSQYTDNPIMFYSTRRTVGPVAGKLLQLALLLQCIGTVNSLPLTMDRFHCVPFCGTGTAYEALSPPALEADADVTSATPLPELEDESLPVGCSSVDCKSQFYHHKYLDPLQDAQPSRRDVADGPFDLTQSTDLLLKNSERALHWMKTLLHAHDNEKRDSASTQPLMARDIASTPVCLPGVFPGFTSEEIVDEVCIPVSPQRKSFQEIPSPPC